LKANLHLQPNESPTRNIAMPSSQTDGSISPASPVI
jgi:hypothetical protein